MVEVEDSPHEEEREVMEAPSNKQPTSTREKLVHITCMEEEKEGGGED